MKYFLLVNHTIMHDFTKYFSFCSEIVIVHRIVYIYCFIQVFSKHTKKCLPWLLKGPIRRYHNPTCFFVFQRKMLFPEQLCHFQYDGGLQNTRLTENGRPPEPNLCMVSLISMIKAYIHPNLFLTASKSLKARLVVFSSRHAILQFWSFRSL